MKKYTLGEIAYFVENRISSEDILLSQYVTTDSLLQNKKGRTLAQNLPPQKCSLTHFKEGDVLLGNIRPYLKKIWFANIDGGCSQDVLVLRAKERKYSSFLYALLMQDSFFDYEMKATKGSKMPRGDKTHILNFPISNIKNKIGIGNFLSALDEKIALNSRINAKLEAMAKRLYDYWFVQFEFPFDFAQGKPDAGGTFGNARPPISQAGHTSTLAGQNRTYKTGGGKMVWNEQLKREIPEGWEVKRLGDVDVVKRGTTITEKETTTGNIKVVAGGLDYSYTHGKSNRRENCITISGSGENAGFINFWREPIFASDCSTVQFSDDLDTIMCYFSLKMYEHIFFRKSHKSAQPHIYPADIYEMPFIIPPKEIKEKVRNFFISQNSKIATLQQQSAKLTALRDRLLPLLMNGQVAVSDNSEQAKQNSGLDYEKKFNKWLQNQGLAARGHVDMKTLRAIFNAMDDDDK